MSASTLHDYERVFPESHSFIPDRWLEGDVDLKRKYWAPFGRGSRACIGISLAYVELYHVIAAVFRPNGRKSSRFLKHVLAVLLEIVSIRITARY